MPFAYFQDHIYSVIEKNVKTVGKIVQKRVKGNTLRFQLLPIRDSSSQSDKTSSDGSENSNGSLWLGAFILVLLVSKYVILNNYYYYLYFSNQTHDLKAADNSSEEK